ncbi:hypothetical protein DBZ36_06905 [Alginatibacterium sediminis]|uniref:SCO family protein n=1 Tax=Alginatibacterium sediminis TaxID=2164068 RepID=A0A420EHM1_9ALTE|nr:SCO family protein [Alginatibacterium sediminis]RKF20168.1 hypothetical protein DBZ36_06905 [Alginatibacterium sediminis]
MTKTGKQKVIAVLLIILCLSIVPILSLVNNFSLDNKTSYGIYSNNSQVVQFDWFDYTSKEHHFPGDSDSLTYMFLGFLSCSEVCSVRVQQMALLEKKIAKDPQLSTQKIKFMFVSIDPENDTPDLRRQIIDMRSPRFTSAVLNSEHLSRLNRQLGEKINRNLADINHVGKLFLLSKTGKVERIYTANQLSTQAMFNELQHYLFPNT